MTTLDQRILIPASPDTIWDVISNINKNPNWQVDCQEVSLLSSRRTGAGARWRYVSANRSEYVVEITAWYDRLGYEYTFIDGVPFHESRGRIRLQEIPEGTVVQWSLSYEMGGVFSGLRNSLSIQRQFEKTMAESLKALYSHVRKIGSDREVSDAKSLMRDAPDYEARAQYVPRHPSRYAEREEEKSGDSEPLIPEPALTEDDTRPNPAITAAEAGDSAPSIRQPVELEPVSLPVPEKAAESKTSEPAVEGETPEDSAHARFKPPAHSDTVAVQTEIPVEVTGQESAAEEPAQKAPEPVKVSQAEKPEAAEKVEPAAQAEPLESASEQPAPAIQDEAEVISEGQAKPEAVSLPAPDSLGPKFDTSDIDTKEISIWEVFGVPRPSDTRPIQPVKDEEGEAHPANTAAAVETSPAPETPPAAEDTQPVTASSDGEIAARPQMPPAVEPPVAEAPPTTTQSEAVAAVSSIKLGALKPIAPLPRGFRFSARRKLVKLRRRY